MKAILCVRALMFVAYSSCAAVLASCASTPEETQADAAMGSADASDQGDESADDGGTGSPPDASISDASSLTSMDSDGAPQDAASGPVVSRDAAVQDATEQDAGVCSLGPKFPIQRVQVNGLDFSKADGAQVHLFTSDRIEVVPDACTSRAQGVVVNGGFELTAPGHAKGVYPRVVVWIDVDHDGGCDCASDLCYESAWLLLTDPTSENLTPDAMVWPPQASPCNAFVSDNTGDGP